MEFLQRLPLPRRLSSRLWLVSLPSALLTFERRQRLPPLPIGRFRFLGLPLIALGVGLALRAWRQPLNDTRPASPDRLPPKPGVVAGLLVLGGLALLLRSLALALYSLAIALAAGANVVAVEEPRPQGFLVRRDRPEV